MILLVIYYTLELVVVVVAVDDCFRMIIDDEGGEKEKKNYFILKLPHQRGIRFVWNLMERIAIVISFLRASSHPYSSRTGSIATYRISSAQLLRTGISLTSVK